jgi:hypothetical protein
MNAFEQPESYRFENLVLVSICCLSVFSQDEEASMASIVEARGDIA